MTGVDIWAAAAALVAGACLALRANMLKPDFTDWCSAPRAVWLGLFALSVVMTGAGINILSGGGASGREAATYTAMAVSAVLMLVNLHRQMIEARGAKEEAGHVDLETVNR
jgi:hypothetical protein